MEFREDLIGKPCAASPSAISLPPPSLSVNQPPPPTQWQQTPAQWQSPAHQPPSLLSVSQPPTAQWQAPPPTALWQQQPIPPPTKTGFNAKSPVTLLLLAIFVPFLFMCIAAGTNNWASRKASGIEMTVGPFGGCQKGKFMGQKFDECVEIHSDCYTYSEDGKKSGKYNDCGELVGVQATSVLAPLFLGLALAGVVLSHFRPSRIVKLSVLGLVVLGAFFGMLAMSLWADHKNEEKGWFAPQPDISLGRGFELNSWDYWSSSSSSSDYQPPGFDYQPPSFDGDYPSVNFKKVEWDYDFSFVLMTMSWLLAALIPFAAKYVKIGGQTYLDGTQSSDQFTRMLEV